MRDVVVIAHDIRSTHNIGALFRTAEIFGVTHLYCTGYTPYPAMANDDRLPHIRQKLSAQIEKTALGTTVLLPWSHEPDILQLLQQLRIEGYEIVALEQSRNSVILPKWTPAKRVAVLLGREVEGIDPVLLGVCDTSVEIPQLGQKESLNVTQAAAIMLYHVQNCG